MRKNKHATALIAGMLALISMGLAGCKDLADNPYYPPKPPAQSNTN